MTKITQYFGIFCFVCSFALADEANTFSLSQRAMVVAENAQLFVGEESRGPAGPGSILQIGEMRGAWLYVPARDAWIKVDQVVPIEKTEAHFTRIIKEEPTPEAFHHRGIARHALGFDKLAMEDLDEAIRRGLRSPALFINRANVWLKLGNDRNALADISQAIEADPKNALAHNNRALIWASIGNLDNASDDFAAALRLDPEFAEAFNNRGVTRAKQQKYDAAVTDFSRAIELNESYAEAFANRGYARKQLGQFVDALGDYSRAVELAPNAPQAFNDAAWLVATCPDTALHDGQRAVEYAVHACEATDYKNADYLDTLAAAYARAGQFEQAVSTQKQAITILPEAARQAAQSRLALYEKSEAYIEAPSP